MTPEEAKALKSFRHYCTCGGFAWQMNKRQQSDPHMRWCPQDLEYRLWYQAMHPPRSAPDTRNIEIPTGFHHVHS